MRKKGKSKKKAMTIHAQRRAFQRHGMEIGTKGLTEIAKMIQDSRGTFVRKQSNRVVIWDVVYREETRRVAYDKIRKCIITFMPKG
jgi:hypothetical protein